MTSKILFLVALPAAVALLAGAALPFETASDIGHPPWGTLAASLGIITLALRLLLRTARAARRG